MIKKKREAPSAGAQRCGDHRPRTPLPIFFTAIGSWRATIAGSLGQPPAATPGKIFLLRWNSPLVKRKVTSVVIVCGIVKHGDVRHVFSTLGTAICQRFRDGRCLHKALPMWAQPPQTPTHGSS